MNAMNAKATAFCTAVIGLACLMVPFQSWSALTGLAPEHAFGVCALILVAMSSEVLGVNATVGRHKASSSIAFIPFFACVLLFPAPAALLTTTATFAVTQFLVHKRPPFRALFNVSQAAISMAVANAVYESLGGIHSTSIQFGVQDLTALIGLALTFFFVNQFSVSIAIAFINGERISTVFSRMVAPGGGNLLYDVLASPVAVVVAMLYSTFHGATGIFIGILPLLIIRHSYAANVKLQQANKDLLTVLVKAIETRDPYTSGHSIRVSILARAIAEDMGLSPHKVDRIEMTALVHDVGKVDAIFVPIISKEGPLTDAERHIIQTHAAKGADFLTTLASVNDDIIKGVRNHHERYDGAGYPDGLSGQSIPLEARIIMICDSIDAMLSDRPYRKALAIDAVRAELLRCAGSQFDPIIVTSVLEKNTLERAAFLVRPEHGRTRLAVTA